MSTSSILTGSDTCAWSRSCHLPLCLPPSPFVGRSASAACAPRAAPAVAVAFAVRLLLLPLPSAVVGAQSLRPCRLPFPLSAPERGIKGVRRRLPFAFRRCLMSLLEDRLPSLSMPLSSIRTVAVYLLPFASLAVKGRVARPELSVSSKAQVPIEQAALVQLAASSPSPSPFRSCPDTERIPFAYSPLHCAVPSAGEGQSWPG